MLGLLNFMRGVRISVAFFSRVEYCFYRPRFLCIQIGLQTFPCTLVDKEKEITFVIQVKINHLLEFKMDQRLRFKYQKVDISKLKKYPSLGDNGRCTFGNQNWQGLFTLFEYNYLFIITQQNKCTSNYCTIKSYFCIENPNYFAYYSILYIK